VAVEAIVSPFFSSLSCAFVLVALGADLTKYGSRIRHRPPERALRIEDNAEAAPR
jgi:hypothetical protein